MNGFLINSTLREKDEYHDDYFLSLMQNWESCFGNYLKGYLLPIGVILAIINNLLILYICSFGSGVKRSVSVQMRIYYSVLAFFGVSTALSLHGTYFAGKQ